MAERIRKATIMARTVNHTRLLVLIGIRQRIEELDQLLPDLNGRIQAIDVVSETL
jgi:hypothetical protein